MPGVWDFSMAASVLSHANISRRRLVWGAGVDENDRHERHDSCDEGHVVASLGRHVEEDEVEDVER